MGCLFIDLPITDSTWIFLMVLLIILFAPMILRPLKIPYILGIILAGVIIGPHGFNILARDKSIEIFGQVGLYYIMFLAALEMDTRSIFKNVKKYLFFGLLTFAIPFILVYFGSKLILGYSDKMALLMCGILSSNTLIAYPIVGRYGLGKHRSVALAVGGTMMALLLSLIIVAAVAANGNEGQNEVWNWMLFATKIILFGAVSIIFIPRLTRVFLRYYSDAVSQFIFVMAILILTAGMADVCGIEGILGAFLAGLILNRYIPKVSPLMNRLEFVGNALFIPYFLIGVGMLININSLFTSINTMEVVFFMVILGTFAKALAAYISARGMRMSWNSGHMMFGLTSAHAAGGIAITMVGMRLTDSTGMPLMNNDMLNGVVVMILITCIISSFITENAARRLTLEHREELPETDLKGDDEKILLPLKDETIGRQLIDIATMMRNQRLNRGLIGLNVVYDDVDSKRNQKEGRELLEHLTKVAAGMDVRIQTQSRLATNVANGIVHAFKEYDASEIIVGMHPIEDSIASSYGNTVDSLIHRLNRQIILERIHQPLNTLRKIRVLIPDKAEFEPGFFRWVERLARMASSLSCRIEFHGAKKTTDLIDKYLHHFHHNVAAEYVDMDIYDLPSHADNIADDHLLVVIAGRRGTVSYHHEFEKIPAYLMKNFVNLNVMVIFPDQYGTTTDEITFAAPQQNDEKSGLAIFRRFFTKKK